jgi:hypothetical protein
VPAQTFLSVTQTPKAVSIVEEAEVIAEEPDPAVPEELVEEEVAVPKPKPKAKTKKDAPASTKKKTNLTTKHTCGSCGKVMSLHTAMYGHKNCPGEMSIPQPPALVRQTAIEPPTEPQMSQARVLRYHLANAAQERRAQAHLKVVGPIRQFYGL